MSSGLWGPIVYDSGLAKGSLAGKSGEGEESAAPGPHPGQISGMG